MSEGLDAWCYDALELPRVFAIGLHATTVTRSFEVIETVFDLNPAMHATLLRTRVPANRYLATAADDDEVVRYLRTGRSPGRTTVLAIESELPILWWTVDGTAPDAIPLSVPGDPSAGIVDETTHLPVLYRAIVSPGVHSLRCAREHAAISERTIEVPAGQVTTISIG